MEMQQSSALPESAACSSQGEIDGVILLGRTRIFDLGLMDVAMLQRENLVVLQLWSVTVLWPTDEFTFGVTRATRWH